MPGPFDCPVFTPLRHNDIWNRSICMYLLKVYQIIPAISKWVGCFQERIDEHGLVRLARLGDRSEHYMTIACFYDAKAKHAQTAPIDKPCCKGVGSSE
jgi:hypothetical protein